GLVVRPCERDDAGPHEAADIVDMAVRLILIDTAAEPDEFFDGEIVRKHRLDLLSREAGIAVRIEKAFLGGEECALAICMDGAAFEHDGRAVAVHALDLRDLGGDEIVLVPGEIEAAIEPAPGIEYPVDGTHATLPVHDEGGAAIAHP